MTLSSQSIIDFFISAKYLLADFLFIIFYALIAIFSYVRLIIKDYSLSTPIALILIGFLITKRISNEQLEISKANREQELRISQENNEEEILQKYLESIEKLLLDYELNDDDENNQARNVARFKTLTVLRRLTFKPERDKAIILQFLYDTELIKIQNDNDKTSKLSLYSFDFRQADLNGAYLFEANLNGVYLQGANLNGVYLEGANLEGANLNGANLNGAYLFEANLNRADLNGVNLEGAYLYKTESLDIKQLKSANNWEEAVYTQAKWDNNEFRLVIIDKEANKAKIQELRELTEGDVQF